MFFTFLPDKLPVKGLEINVFDAKGKVIIPELLTRVELSLSKSKLKLSELKEGLNSFLSKSIETT